MRPGRRERPARAWQEEQGLGRARKGVISRARLLRFHDDRAVVEAGGEAVLDGLRGARGPRRGGHGGVRLGEVLRSSHL